MECDESTILVKSQSQPNARDTLFELKHPNRCKLQVLPIKDLTVDGVEAFTADDLASLADSIRRVGLINKPTVMRNGSTYRVLVGRRRVAAMQLLASLDPTTREIECYVRDGRTTSPADIAKLVLSENARRSANVLVELDSIKILMRQDRMRVKAVARSIGQTPAWVHKRLKLDRLPKPAMRLMREGRMRFETALAIAKLVPADQQAVLDLFWSQQREDPNAVLSSKAVSDALSKSAAPLPQALFAPLPSPSSGKLITALKAARAELLDHRERNEPDEAWWADGGRGTDVLRQIDEALQEGGVSCEP